MSEQNQHLNLSALLQVMDSLNHKVFVMNSEARIVYANAAFRAMLGGGFTLQESDLIPLIDDLSDFIKRLTKNELGEELPLSFQTSSGVTTLMMHLSQLPADEPLWLFQEQTLLNNSLIQEALTQREVLFRSFIEQSNDGMAIIDPEGKLILWNHRLTEFTGISAAEAQGQFVWDVYFQVLPRNRQAMYHSADEIKLRIFSLLQNHNSHQLGNAVEMEILRKDGVVRLISSMMFPIELDGRQSLGLILRDITDIKKSELELLENQEYIRTLYNDSPIPVLVIEEKSLQIYTLNKAALRAFRYVEPGEVIGLNIEEMLPLPNENDLYFNRQQILEKLELISRPGSQTFDCHFRTREGNIWDAKVYPFRLPIHDNDLIQFTLIDTTAQNQAMKALFESESRYRAVAENANAGIVIVDLDERILFSNETFAGMLDYSKDEIIGQLISRYVPEDTYHLMVEKTLRRFSGVVDQYEAEFFHRNGDILTFSISASPLYSSEKQMVGTVCVLIDITEKKLATQKLLETTEKLQAILASMPDMIFIHDREGRYLDLYINQKIYTDIDHQPKPGQTLSDVFGAEQASRMKKHIEKSLEKSETVVAPFDLLVNDKVRYFEARISPMGEDKVISVVRDITTLIQLENEVMSSNDLLRVLNALATRFINLPLDQIEPEINRAIAEIGNFTGVDRVYIFDYDWEEDSMSNTYEWCSEYAEPAINELQHLPNSLVLEWVKSHQSGEMTHVPSVDDLPKDENLYHILKPQGIRSLITIPLMEGDKCLAYIGFDTVRKHHQFSDNEISLLRIFAELLTNLKIKQRTEGMLVQTKEILQKQNDQLLSLNNLLRRQNEEIIQKNSELDIQRERAQASDKLKTAFLNNVSHELRTPLNGIVGFAQFLADDNLSAEDKMEFVSAMNISVSRLTDTVNDIMDMSLLMSGNMIVRDEVVDMQKMVAELYRKFDPEAKSKNLSLELSEKPLPDTAQFHSDSGLLKKVFNEMIDNAIKYTQKGFVRFGYEFLGNELRLFVEDSGIGISSEAKLKVFEPFMQEDNSSTRKYEGSGLGLAIVSGITQLLNGQINLESTYPHGTLFSINIPSMLQSQPETNPATLTEEATGPSILIAEDEVLNVLYLKRILKNSGFNLVYAQNGEEAVRIVDEDPNIKMVLMDIKMPVMDGLEATRIIRASHSKLPIIAVTAYAANDDRYTCIAAGCNDYISKPFTADDLKHLVKKYSNLSES